MVFKAAFDLKEKLKTLNKTKDLKYEKFELKDYLTSD